MLKKRLAGTVIVKGGHVVQSIQYKKFLPIGSPAVTVEFLSSWGVDEIVFLDIDASKESRSPSFELLKKCSQKCFVPLTYGGGVKTIEQVRTAIHTGADKVAVNSALLDTPKFLTEAANKFGAQCLVACVDVVSVDGDMCVYDHRKKSVVSKNALGFIRELSVSGAGEVFISSVARNGMKSGLEIEFARKVRESVTVPVILAGGVGNPDHVYDAFIQADVSCVAVGNTLSFSEHAVQTMKSHLASRGIDVRRDMKAVYDGYAFDAQLGRVKPPSEALLKEQRFEIIRDERI